MSYLALKHIHVAAVVLSLSFFLLRGLLMLNRSPRLEQPWIRRTADVIDAALLFSAFGLAFTLRQYPFIDSWLTAKVIALLLYIVLGSIALKRGRTHRIRVAALCAALLTVGYIISVALTHSAAPWRALL